MDNAEFRQIAYEVARHHHEKYNGGGYPDGLMGEQIPLHARIMAIADVFDAMYLSTKKWGMGKKSAAAVCMVFLLGAAAVVPATLHRL